jgi:ribosome-associated translation inhibitor RaiA
VIVQIHTDNHIENTDGLKAQVESLVAGAVERVSDRVSRVQVHLGDVNSSKGGDNDKRCMIEVRLDGRPPVAVTQSGPTIEQAMNGAAQKLERSLGNIIDRLRDH